MKDRYQNKLERLHDMEDVINMELKYRKDTDCIVRRFLYQKNIHDLSQDIQDFHLTEEEMTILDIFYFQWGYGK